MSRLLLALAGVALIGAWLGYFFITLTPGLESETFRATVVLHLATCAVLAPYLVYTFARGRLPGGSPLDWPIVLGLAAYGVTTAASIAWRLSLEASLLSLAAVGVFIVLADGRVFRRWQVEAGLMLAVVAAAGYGIWKAGEDYNDWLQLTRAVEGSLGLRDLIPPTVPRIHDVGDFVTILGMVLGVSVPLFLATALRGGATRVLAIAGLLVVLLGLFLTLARGAWVGAALGSAVTLGGAFWLGGGLTWLRDLPPARRRWVLAGAVVLIAVACALVLAAVIVTSDTRPGWLFRSSLSPRRDKIDEAFDAIAGDPLLGHGPGAYGLLFNSHNGYLQVLADLGVVGGIAAAILIVVVGWMLVSGLRRADWPTQLSLLGVSGGFVALAVHGLVDTPTLWKASLAATAALAALAVHGWRDATKVDEAEELALEGAPAIRDALLRQTPRVLILLALISLPVWWARIDWAHYRYNDAVYYANHQSWDAALRDGREAARLDPDLAIYQMQQGITEVQAYQETNDPDTLQSGIAHLRRGVELEPEGGLGYANLAIALSLAGDREGARDAALAAIDRQDRFVDDDPSLPLAAGAVLEQNGWQEEAIKAYQEALGIDARLADSDFWSASPFRRENLGRIVGESLIALNHCLMLQLHVTSDDEALKAALQPFDDALYDCQLQVVGNPTVLENRIMLAQGLIAAGRYDEALNDHLNYVVQRQSDFGPAHTALGQLYAAQGQLDRARAEWTKAAQLGEPLATLQLGDSYAPDPVPAEVIDRMAGQLPQLATEAQHHSIAVLYYRMLFLRASPWVMLLPGEWEQAAPRAYVRAREALDRWRAPAGQ